MTSVGIVCWSDGVKWMGKCGHEKGGHTVIMSLFLFGPLRDINQHPNIHTNKHTNKHNKANGYHTGAMGITDRHWSRSE